MKVKKISIVIPTFNEEENVIPLYLGIFDTLEETYQTMIMRLYLLITNQMIVQETKSIHFALKIEE